MSLDAAERAATAADLHRNLGASGLTRADLVAWLGLSDGPLDAALTVDGADPTTVCYLRDAHDAALREHGGTPRWSILTVEARTKAHRWVPLRDVPARPAG